MNCSRSLLNRIAGAVSLLLVAALPLSAQANPPCSSGKPCYNAGPFTAEIVNLVTSRTPSYGGNTVSLRFYMQLQNLTAQSIVIGYRSASSVLIDNEANRYRSDDSGVKGIGLTSEYKLDPQLVLQPGEARTLTFESQSTFTDKQIFGTIYNYDLTFDQLEITPSQQARKLREYNMNFANVAASTFASAPSTNIANAPSANTGAQYQLYAQPGQQPAVQGSPQQQVAQQPQAMPQQPVYQQQPAAYQQQQQQPVYQQPAQQQPVYQQPQQPVYQQAGVQQAVYQQPQQGYQQPQQGYQQGAYPQQLYNAQGQPIDPNAKPDKMQKVNDGIESAKKLMGLFGGSKEKE